MKKFMVLFSLSLFLGSSLSAALPPLYQSLAEIKSIVEDKKLGVLLQSGAPITSILKTDTGYLITTSQQELEANVIYERMAHPGPAKFHIEFQSPKLK